MSDTLDQLHRIIVEENSRARGRSIARRRKIDLTRPSASWTSKSKVGDEVGTSLAIVFATPGCSHAQSDSGGCTMCSYLLDGAPTMATAEEFVHQFDFAMKKLENESIPLAVKMYTSGSLLDSEEMPDEARRKILERIADDNRIIEVIIESRPEYASESVLSEIRSILGDRHVEIGVGLESINDRVRSICINKGFDSEEFKRTVERARAHQIGIRAYVLVKPPFLTERDAILDSIKTIEAASSFGVTTVSVNPVNIQKYTLVERLWSRGHYRPPWLWSVVEVLKQASAKIESSTAIVCDPAGGGKFRGTHNCGSCDSDIVVAIREFSLDQEPSVFETLDCSCRFYWQHVLEHEDFSLEVHSDRFRPMKKD